MDPWHFLFWLCGACAAYVCVGYPLLLAVIGLFQRNPPRLAPFTGSISIILAARNEEENLERRLRALIGLLKASQLAGEVVVVSDGSTDRTVAIARTFSGGDLVSCAYPPGRGRLGLRVSRT